MVLQYAVGRFQCGTTHSIVDAYHSVCPLDDDGAAETALSPYYFSVVTLTTLGYGDVLPNSLAAQILVIIQVIIGYVMLGGVLSIFANKMSRRAD